MVNDPYSELLYLERYYMSNMNDVSREELYESFTKHLKEIECEISFLKKQVRERDLRIQLYQFSDSKLSELKENLDAFPSLKEVWRDFEVAYKLATGKNPIKFTELNNLKKEFEDKVRKIK